MGDLPGLIWSRWLGGASGDTGTVIVMDERIGGHFTGEPDPLEQFMCGCSAGHVEGTRVFREKRPARLEDR